MDSWILPTDCGGGDEENTMKWALLGAVIWLTYLVHLDGKNITELRARINAIEATLEPVAYFSVDFDNRLAKAEGAWRMEEENENDGR